MNISFDLDSTLIPVGNEFETEKANIFTFLFGVEKLRKGTSLLFKELKKEGHKINIYTTSCRSKSKIRFMFYCYGIRVNNIVNEMINRKELLKKNIYSSKYPPAFGFEIHIDDLKGVEMEGEKFGFKTIIIEPSELNWRETVINGLRKNNI